MNTNIEPGCLCMAIDTINFGLTLVPKICVGQSAVLLYGNEIRSTIPGDRLWKVDRPVQWPSGDWFSYFPERYLRRIDGHTEDKQTETVKEKVDGY